jgi:virulence-associated protein VapD
MATGRKQISFDLDTTALKDYYPKKNWQHAYDDIKRHMKNNEFSWLQGSVYVSDKPLPERRAINIIGKLVDRYKWLHICMRDCVVTNIGKEHGLNHLFDKDADVPRRESGI